VITSSTKEIFGDALELSGESRAAFLDRACAGDETLRQRLLALLKAAESDDGFLGAAVIEGGNGRLGEALDEGVGSTIGSYELVQLLGEGGFGSVFKAQQTHPVRRMVALKVIKMGMDTRAVVSRFEQERQALALMDHPHIAKVFDAGATRSGRPYFVMELVEGQAITAYSDTHCLSIPQRLALFIQVCQAVQHAHTKGVIHRDLKPSNVLVASTDSGPFARVIDFGIAKATRPRANDSMSMTDHRQFLGTPQYMSPEQASGSMDVDTRSDVYSLGVLLYELLTGATPFDAESLGTARLVEMQRILTEVEPPAPSTRVSKLTTLSTIAASRHVEPARLGSMLRGELDWVVMRALEKDRSRRYTSPHELAGDVLRYMNGEAVVAAPPDRSYRLRKMIARNRGPVAWASAVAAATLIGLAAALWQASIADSERAEAHQRGLETERMVSFQVEQMRQIDPHAMGMAIRSDLLEAFKASIAQTPLPQAQREVQEQEFISRLDETNFTDVALHMLETTFFDRTIPAIRESFVDQPLVQARLNQSTSETMRHLGLIQASRDPIAAALDIRRTMLGQDHELTIATQVSLGRLNLMSGDLEKAEGVIKDAVERAQRTLGGDSALALEALYEQGVLCQVRSRLRESEDIFTLVLDRRQRTLGADHVDTVRSRAALGMLLSVRGRRDEAARVQKEALEQLSRVLGTEHRETLTLKTSFAMVLRQQKRLDESERLLREVLEARHRLRGASHPETLATLNFLGVTLRVQGRLAEAEDLYRQALAGYRRTLGAMHSQTLNTMSHLAGLLAVTQRPAEAEALYCEALAGNEKITGIASLPTAIIRHDFAQFLQAEGRFADAEALFLGAQGEIERSASASSSYHVSILRNLIEVYEAWNAAEPSRGHDLKAQEVREKLRAAEERQK
jgi:eukaryotic-like serine/threonine-protein kinase